MGKAIEHHQAALEIAREIGDRRNEGVWLGNLGNAYRNLGEVGQAIEHHQAALEIAREIGDRRGEGNALCNLGLAYARLGETRRAIEHHQAALEVAREIGDRRGEALRSWNLGLLYEDSDPARAVELMAVCVAYEQEIGHPDAEADARHLAELRARL